MFNIDALIEKSKYMEIKDFTISGSVCYDFGDVVLVRYQGVQTLARENEEKLMIQVNLKSDIGVNTPRHLAMKRVQNETVNYCYVLQEKALGVNFSEYCDIKDPLAQIKKQKDIFNK